MWGETIKLKFIRIRDKIREFAYERGVDVLVAYVGIEIVLR